MVTVPKYIAAGQIFLPHKTYKSNCPPNIFSRLSGGHLQLNMPKHDYPCQTLAAVLKDNFQNKVKS